MISFTEEKWIVWDEMQSANQRFFISLIGVSTLIQIGVLWLMSGLSPLCWTECQVYGDLALCLALLCVGVGFIIFGVNSAILNHNLLALEDAEKLEQEQ